MIDIRQEISNQMCDACWLTEPGARWFLFYGPPDDNPPSLCLCSSCRRAMAVPLRYGFLKGSCVRVLAKGYDKEEKFQVVDIYDDAKAVRVKDEEGKEHIVRLVEVELR